MSTARAAARAATRAAAGSGRRRQTAAQAGFFTICVHAAQRFPLTTTRPRSMGACAELGGEEAVQLKQVLRAAEAKCCGALLVL